MKNKIFSIKILDSKFAICKLNPNSNIPTWIQNKAFYSVTKTADELSIVCFEECVPKNIMSEKGWKAIVVDDELDFSLIGIISSISTSLSKNGISVFVISTFNTDYILVKEENLKSALAILSENFFVIE